MILQVKSITHLRELISNGMNRYFIRLNFGVKSSKWIEMTGNNFYIFHEIDGSDDVFTEQELNERLSKIFNKRIEVEQGQYDDDWIGDDYKTFSVDDEEIGGYFDIYYIQMPRREEFCYITEVNYYFE